MNRDRAASRDCGALWGGRERWRGEWEFCSGGHCAVLMTLGVLYQDMRTAEKQTPQGTSFPIQLFDPPCPALAPRCRRRRAASFPSPSDNPRSVTHKMMTSWCLQPISIGEALWLALPVGRHCLSAWTPAVTGSCAR